MNNQFCVYKHTSPSGKSYIGQTNNFKRRSRDHKTRRDCSAFHCAVKKYGWNSFTHEILIENISIDEANDWEQFYIFIENSISPNGYNLTSGGHNSIPCAETRALWSKQRTGKKPTETTLLILSEMQKGRVFSDSHKLALSKAIKGRVLSDKHKAAMSKSRTGKKLSGQALINVRAANSRLKGIPRTETTKAKISSKTKGRIASKETRDKMSISRLAMDIAGGNNIRSKEYKITLPTGELTIIKGLNCFCKENGLSAASMTRVAQGKQKTKHKGFFCEYVTTGGGTTGQVS